MNSNKYIIMTINMEICINTIYFTIANENCFNHIKLYIKLLHITDVQICFKNYN